MCSYLYVLITSVCVKISHWHVLPLPHRSLRVGSLLVKLETETDFSVRQIHLCTVESTVGNIST